MSEPIRTSYPTERDYIIAMHTHLQEKIESGEIVAVRYDGRINYIRTEDATGYKQYVVSLDIIKALHEHTEQTFFTEEGSQK